MGDQRSKATPKCTTTGSDCSPSSPYFLVINRDRQIVRAAVYYIENVIWLTTRCYEISVNVVTLKALSEPAVLRTTLDSLLPEMMKSVGVGLWDRHRDEWRRVDVESVSTNERRRTDPDGV